MTSTLTRTGTVPLVPLSSRIRYLQLVRVTGAAVVLAGVALGSAGANAASVLALTIGYLAVAAVTEVFWRASAQRSLFLFNVVLLVDGLFVAATVYLSGGMSSDMRFLALLYALGATLLASYRTGVKFTVWVNLMLYAVHRAHGTGLVLAPADMPPGDARGAFVTATAVLWAVTVGAALLSAVNERELRAQRYDLLALAELARRLERETRPQGVAQGVIDALRDTYDVRRAVFVRGNGERDVAIAAHPPLADDGVLLGAGAPVLDEVAVAGRPLLIARLEQDAAGPLAGLLPDAVNVVVLPVRDEDGSAGAILCERGAGTGARLDRRTLAMMEQFAAHAGLALRRADLLEQLRRNAETDSLTGLANRRTFDETLAAEVARSARSGEPLGLLLIDIDHFKKLNDTHGHQQGDAVLRTLGGLLRALVRSYHTPARYGGEEFAVVLPGCGTAEAVVVAERIRSSLATGGTPVPVTASIGVSSAPADGVTAAELLGAADAALYAAKRAGRNQVCAAGASAETASTSLR